MRCALVENSTNLVMNLIIADPVIDPAPSGYTLFGLAEDSPVSIGWTWDGQSFVNPIPE